MAVLLSMAGCATEAALSVTSPLATAAASPEPDLRNVNPRAVVAGLSAATDLAAAASELAAALGVAPNLVRARHLPGGCTLCATDETGGNDDPVGLDVAAVAAAAQPGDRIHLFVGRFVCVFSYDGTRYAPESCHITSF